MSSSVRSFVTMIAGIVVFHVSASGAVFVSLGGIEGAFVANSTAIDVSDDGKIILGRALNTNPNGAETVAVLWEDGVIRELGKLPSGAPAFIPMALSPQGDRALGWDFVLNTFRWWNGELDVYTFTDGGSNTMRIFEGISAEGSVIGYSQGGRALLWKDDVVTWLGSQSGENGIEGVPKGISNDGSVIAGYGLRGSINEAFRWTSESLTWLGFTGEGAVQSWGMDVSADGNVLVGYNTTASGTLAFRWQDGTMVALDPIDPDKKDPVSNEPYDGSIALGISGDGSIVVGEDLTAFEGRTAVMWAAENQYAPVRLNDIVEPADRDFFNMTDVEAISADGKTIVGTGKDKGGGTAAYALLLIDDWAGYPVEPDGQSVNTGEYLGWIDIKEKPWIYIYAIDTYAYLPEEFVGPSGAWLWMLR